MEWPAAPPRERPVIMLLDNGTKVFASVEAPEPVQAELGGLVFEVEASGMQVAG